MYKSIMYKYYIGSLSLSLLFIIFVKEFNIWFTTMYSYTLIATICFALFSIKKHGNAFVKEKYPNLYKEYIKNCSNNKCYVLWASDTEKNMHNVPIGISLVLNKFNTISNFDEDIVESFKKDLNVILLKKDGILWIIYVVFVFILMIFCSSIIYIFKWIGTIWNYYKTIWR